MFMTYNNNLVPVILNPNYNNYGIMDPNMLYNYQLNQYNYDNINKNGLNMV